MSYIEEARAKDERAHKLEELSKKSDAFILMGTKPFDGGPPSLLVVGGTDTKDGSAFVPKKRRNGSEND